MRNKKQTFEGLKKVYEKTEIPDELSQIVQDTILRARQDFTGGDTMNEIGKEINKANKNKSVKRSLIGFAAAVAVFVGVFGVTVNTNQAFAESMQDVPVLGTLTRVLTGFEIKEKDNVADIDALIPEVQGLKDQALQAKINQEVKAKVEAAVKETKKEIAEYKEAWLATGGKEEDYVPLEINVDYHVKCINEDTLSFVIYKTQTLANAYYEEIYYNYDLNKSKELTLKDVLGKDYKEISNEQVRSKIAERSKDQEFVYFKENEGGFTSIADDQSFYINSAGNPVVVFQKYEIAPGFMGVQEFEIAK